ncbi:MAG: DUF4123 domain-containing protein [Thiohalomonadales bacterium]
MNDIKETLSHLLSNDDSRLYAILDGALIKNLRSKLSEFKQKDEYVSLYRNTIYSNLNEIAPYLVHLDIDEPLFDWWLENGWNKYWGILCTSQSDLDSLAIHFRQFLTVTDYNKNKIMFRFYDPRVFNTFIKSCSDRNYLEFENNVDHYCLVDKNNEFVIIPRRTFDIQELSL